MNEHLEGLLTPKLGINGIWDPPVNRPYFASRSVGYASKLQKLDVTLHCTFNFIQHAPMHHCSHSMHALDSPEAMQTLCSGPTVAPQSLDVSRPFCKIVCGEA